MIDHILMQHPEYEMPPDRLELPVSLGRARLVDNRLFYTYCYPRGPFDKPDAEVWQADGPVLWLMDVIWCRSLSARDAVERLSNDVVEHSLAREGERVVFWRSAANRFGSGIARRRQSG
ncbi:MAG: hypothetical protein GY813_09505 [Halieaceae bacterium]|nr:hypothetical protein [Halieaceae bacterium]